MKATNPFTYFLRINKKKGCEKKRKIEITLMSVVVEATVSDLLADDKDWKLGRRRAWQRQKKKKMATKEGRFPVSSSPTLIDTRNVVADQ